MSLSINTNQSSMVALETLNATQTDLNQTTNAVSTGKKVSNASDNPAAFGISSQIGGDIQGQSAVNDGLSYAAQIVSSTNSAANSIITVLQQVQNAVTSIGNHQGDSASLASINKEITGYMNQINTIARNATTKGVNLLASSADGYGITSGSMSFVTGLNGATTNISAYASAIQGTTKASTSSVTLTDSLGLTSGMQALGDASSNVFLTSDNKINTSVDSTFGGDSKGVNAMISTVQTAIEAMTNVTSDLGAQTQTIQTMSAYGQKVSDSLTSASGALTDADMSAESAKLTSLQTKQSLGIKSLSIANGQSQNILSLFQS